MVDGFLVYKGSMKNLKLDGKQTYYDYKKDI